VTRLDKAYWDSYYDAVRRLQRAVFSTPTPTPVPDDPETLAWEDEDLRPCTHCGRRFSEAEIELTQGWCPCCGGKWEAGS
jgi:hypothetical protein